jgi:anti-sigma regulatory factor (Ser/Thr protein kinase)
MASTAVEPETMIMLVLFRDPGQVAMTRCLVRAALEHRGLGNYADDAEAITSELVTNAIQHATTDTADKIGVTLLRAWDGEAVSVVVTDPSPVPPVKREAIAAGEHGRGLHIVEALSAHWAWNPEEDGKAIYAILTRKK